MVTWKCLLALIALLCAGVATAEELSEQAAPVPKRTFVGTGVTQAGRFEDFFLRVVTHERVIYAQPGETIHFTMYVRRGTMERVAHDVQVTDVDPRFELTLEPSTIPTLRHIDMVPMRATLFVPGETAPGDYVIRIHVKGAEFIEESYPLDTIIRAGSRRYLLNYAYLGMLGLIVAIMLVRYKTIKRRKT